MISEEINEENQ